jgi:hypothetical protein
MLSTPSTMLDTPSACAPRPMRHASEAVGAPEAARHAQRAQHAQHASLSADPTLPQVRERGGGRAGGRDAQAGLRDIGVLGFRNLKTLTTLEPEP